MSRSGYTDDADNLAMYRGHVASAIRGKRGQALLIDLVKALDAMPDKRLIDGELISDGGVCALGAVGVRRGIDMSRVDPYDSETVARIFNIADQLAREVVYINDEGGEKLDETPQARWQRVRQWAVSQMLPVDDA